jgi:hypothetical protein
MGHHKNETLVIAHHNKDMVLLQDLMVPHLMEEDTVAIRVSVGEMK